MKQSITLTDFFRGQFHGLLNSVAGFFLRMGFSPNLITFSGFLGHVAAAFLIVNGKTTLAGLVVLLFAPLDALDGAMARLQGNLTQFGAFFDSVIDRYSELILFGGLMVSCILAQDWPGCLAVYVAAAGSILVSYTRARAECLGYSAKIGLLSRLERYLILVPGLILDRPMWAIWIIAILANITAIQRIVFVRKESKWRPQ